MAVITEKMYRAVLKNLAFRLKDCSEHLKNNLQQIIFFLIIVSCVFL